MEKETSNRVSKKKNKKERKKERNNNEKSEKYYANEGKKTRNTEVQINEEKIGQLHEKEFRIIIVKMIKKKT